MVIDNWVAWYTRKAAFVNGGADRVIGGPSQNSRRSLTWSGCFFFFPLLVLHLETARVSADSPDGQNEANTIVRFEVQQGTNALGRMDVELFDNDKPETVRNFLLYVRSGAYSNSFLHRCVPGFVVQGGGFSVTDPLSTNTFSAYLEVTNYGRLANEFLVGPRISNTFATIAMAKVGDDPNSAPAGLQ